MSNDEGGFSSALAFVVLAISISIQLGILTSNIHPLDPRASWLFYGSLAGIIGSILILMLISRGASAFSSDESEFRMMQARAQRQGPRGPEVAGIHLGSLDDIEKVEGPTLETKPEVARIDKPIETAPSRLEDKTLEKPPVTEAPTLALEEQPSKQQLETLKSVLCLSEGSLAYKHGSVYHVTYDRLTKKHKWQRLGSWQELKQKQP